MTLSFLSSYSLRLLSAEISSFSRYYDQIVQWKPIPQDSGRLFDYVQGPNKTKAQTLQEIPDQKRLADNRLALLIHGNFNHHTDIQGELEEIKTRLNRLSRVVLVAYNPFVSWIFRLAHMLGIIKGAPPITYLTVNHISNLARLAGYEVARLRPAAYFPFWWLGIGTLLNTFLPTIPFLKWFSLASVILLRPIMAETSPPSLSIIIPARNESGNIEDALIRMPDFEGAKIEIVFVEGHSKDDTWQEILRVKEKYKDRFAIQAHQQTGKGKNDAVQLGFGVATGRVLTILDADLTMPPEMLGRFYRAYTEGLADFINGNRLVYPMEREAMRPLNRLGNIFFARMLAHTLDIPIGDSLCGTKLLLKSDYERITRWRKDFGDFDPFGDFDLLFSSAVLVFGTVDVPIRYLARTYGSTNISRFSHGLMLLRMTLVGFLRIKTGRRK